MATALAMGALKQNQRQRWLRVAFWLFVCAIAALRFVHLKADFPNDTPWMIDQAKFTDEGWWASGAVMHVLTGNWRLAGDYNPAAALPVWPLLLSAVFHCTGLSLVAARALSASFSVSTLGLVYALTRRYTRPGAYLPALAAVLLLALSPFAFVFGRLAILDPLVVFEFCLALLVASCATRRRIWPLAVLAVLVPVMLLTKTTSAALVPAIFWIAWTAMGRNRIAFLQAALAIAAVPAALVRSYAALVAALGYGADYKYFFQVNAMEDFDWSQALHTFTQLLENCLWIDRILFPAVVAILVLSVAWKRRLWSNPLFAAAWLAVAGQACFIFRRQDDYAPRYFLAMLAPAIFVVVLALDEALAHLAATPASPRRFWSRRMVAPALLLLAIATSAVADGVMTAQFVAHPEYQFYNAANSIRGIVGRHTGQKPLILGVSGAQIALMTGIPSINDDMGTEDMAEKVARYRPGWYLAWSGVSSDDTAVLAPYRLDRVASYPVFDDDDRTPLILYKMTSRTR